MISDAQSPRGSSPRFPHASFSCGETCEPFPGAQGLVSRRPRPGSIPKGIARLAQVGPNLKNGLIGPLTAPNEVPISSPSGKFRGGAKYGPPRTPKNRPRPRPGPWAHGPMGPWPHGPMGPGPMGPGAPHMGVLGPINSRYSGPGRPLCYSGHARPDICAIMVAAIVCRSFLNMAEQ